MNYQETVEYLYSRLPMFQRIGAPAIKYNLDNTNRLMVALGNPHRTIKTIHVAGTNGKGSSSHMIASILQEAGLKVGLYTSPHLKSFTERIRVNGDEILESAVVRFVSNYKELIEDIEPSFFEITFAMSMDYFSDQNVDYAVIEVGMGGRLDSTNVITPEICLVTNISMDHQQFLGDTLPKIAEEKAGIFKTGVPVVIGEYQEEVVDVFNKRALDNDCSITYASQHYFIEQAADDRYNIFKSDRLFLEGVKLDLQGEYQLLNIPGVMDVVDQLKRDGVLSTDGRFLYDGLEKVTVNTGLKGRWQILSDRPLTITDTGHNEAGIKEIMKNISKLRFDKLHIIWGMVDDKHVGSILSLLPDDAQYYFVQANIPRALPLKILLDEAEKVSLTGAGYNSVMEAYQSAKDNANADDLIFIGGSTFVVAEIDDL